MARKLQKQKHFFEVGHKVQLNLNRVFPYNKFEGAYATITRIQLCPDPNFFEDPEDWHKGPHWVNFWVRLDDYPGLNEHVQQMEVPYRYHNLRPVPAHEK